MTNLISYLDDNKVAFQFNAANVIANSYCIFDKSAVRSINKSVHLTPLVGDFDGWYLDDAMKMQHVKRNIQSGLLRYITPFKYGTFSMNISFNNFIGANLIIALVNESMDKRILLLLSEGKTLLKFGKFYSGVSHSPEETYLKSSIYYSPVKLDIRLIWDSKSIFIFHGDKQVFSSHESITEDMYPFIALNINKPYIPYPSIKPLIINSFTYANN